MKKRILLVDDEQLILQGLQRMLRPMRSSWEMHFVDSGEAALRLMARTPCEVVVSDMRMPGMNGAELMNEIMLRYPRSIRLILSGHADQELVLKCVGATHQYLSKPCDPDMLRATVEHAVALEGRLNSPHLRLLASRVGTLPSLPTLYTSLVNAAQRPEISLTEIGDIISQDMAMTAQILKLVNSAFFGLRRQVCNPGEAAQYLGLEVLKSLVLGVHAFKGFDCAEFPGFSVQGLWTHSIACAHLARAIALTEGADPTLSETCFISGLLHDVGELVLAAHFPDESRQALSLASERGIDSSAAEEAVIGSGHGEVGGYLLGLWGLPTPIVEAVTYHHRPSEAAGRGLTALATVHAADALLGSGAGPGEHRPSSGLDMNYLTAIGLADRLPAWRAMAASEGSERRAA